MSQLLSQNTRVEYTSLEQVKSHLLRNLKRGSQATIDGLLGDDWAMEYGKSRYAGNRQLWVDAATACRTWLKTADEAALAQYLDPVIVKHVLTQRARPSNLPF